MLIKTRPFDQMLPPETLELILGHLSRGDLVPMLVVHSSFHHLAARVLYRALVDVPPKLALRLIKTLARNDAYTLFVRRFDLEWSNNVLTANFLRLLHRALQRLRHLSYLGLEFSTTDITANLAWILQDCPFSLRVFSTSMRCDTLARFLETQHAMTEICLRGFSPTMSLAPHALPHLRHLRTVLAPPYITADFVRGRPVETVSLSLSPGDAAAALDGLLLSARPLRRLTVMSFDLCAPAELIAQIAARLPALEALHAVVFPQHSTHASHPFSSVFWRADYGQQAMLRDTAPALANFTALRYITLLAPGAPECEDEAESEIAACWHRACPTLKTIILPQGVMWGCVDGQWVSLQDRLW